MSGLTYITHAEDCAKIVNDLHAMPNDAIGLDVETTSLDIFSAQPLLLQLAIRDTYYIINLLLVHWVTIRDLLQEILHSNVICVGHNIKYDIKILYHNYHVLLVNLFDTMLAETMANRKLYPSLAYLVDKYFSVTLDKEIRDRFITHTGYNFSAQELIYAASDIQYLTQIRDIQLAKIEDISQIKVCELEMSLVPVFASMEYFGISLNKEKWLKNVTRIQYDLDECSESMKKIIREKISEYKYTDGYDLAEKLKIPVKRKSDMLALQQLKDIFALEWAVENFNLASYVQLKEFLNTIYKLGLDNTNEKTLIKYKDNEFISVLLKYRTAKKRFDTYGESFLDNINPVTNKIHTTYNQLGTATGRISSEEPNLQNIIAENYYREPFEASEGKVFIIADYSQAELRLFANISRDKKMIEAFMNNVDLHKVAASFIYNKSVEEITNDERHTGKTLNFAVIYGSSKYGLFLSFGIPLNLGEIYLEKYFTGFSGARAFINLASFKILELGYSITPFGRKRFFERKVLYKDYKEKLKEEGEIRREGVNHIIQGGISDVLKLAMKDIFYTQPFGDKFRMLLQIHDELVVEVDEDIQDDALKFIKTCMEEKARVFFGSVPAIVDAKKSKFWIKYE